MPKSVVAEMCRQSIENWFCGFTNYVFGWKYFSATLQMEYTAHSTVRWAYIVLTMALVILEWQRGLDFRRILCPSPTARLTLSNRSLLRHCNGIDLLIKYSWDARRPTTDRCRRHVTYSCLQYTTLSLSDTRVYTRAIGMLTEITFINVLNGDTWRRPV